MIRIALGVCVAAAGLAGLLAAAPASAPDLMPILHGVENRYNNVRTLQVHFEQTYDAPRRGPKTESGELFLRKPGRMRWEYANPSGKLFVSDGKTLFLYTPDNNRVERSKVKESEDMRAPLGFLLGRVDFTRDFKRFIGRREGNDVWISAEPKSQKAPYTKIEMLVTPDYQIKRLLVAEEGGGSMDFKFTGEKLNVPAPERLFQFQPPKGAEVVEAADQR